MDDAQIESLKDRDAVELARAKIQLKLDSRRLQQPSRGFWEILKTPAFLAAVVPTVITVLVTGSTIFLQNHWSSNDKAAEQARFEQDTNKTILLQVMQSADTAQAAARLNLALSTGLIHDTPDNKFKNAQRNLEDQFRQEILLNILRQHSNEPMSFADVKMNSPFLDGFMKPMDLQTLNYLFRLGYPREMLLWLFVDSIEVDSDSGSIGTRYDPPNDVGCVAALPHDPCFSDYIRYMTASGLAVDTEYMERGSDSGRPITMVYARFCFNSALAQSARGAMGSQHWTELTSKMPTFVSDAKNVSGKCGSQWNPDKDEKQPQPDTFSFSVGSKRFKVTPRSALAIFQFLGNLAGLEMDGQATGQPKMDAPQLWTVADDPALFTVSTVESVDPKKCFVSTKFHDRYYCVPNSAQNSKRIFGVLSQLIGIQTP